MTKEQEAAHLLGVRFRDAVLHAFAIGKRAGESQFGASVLYQEEYAHAVKLWEEIVAHFEERIAAARKPHAAASEPQPSKPPATSAGGVPGKR